MPIIFYISLLILFTSTFIQGHDNFDANTTDDTLSSSSESENALRQHNNPIRIGKYYRCNYVYWWYAKVWDNDKKSDIAWKGMWYI